MSERSRAELALKVAEMVKEEADGLDQAFEVLSLAASLLFGVKYRLRPDP